MSNEPSDSSSSVPRGEAMPSRGLDLVPDEPSVGSAAHEEEFLNTAVQVFLQHECEPARAMLFDGGLNIQLKLARQLAEAHEAAMALLNRGQAECNAVDTARLMNVAVRLMTAFQQGVALLRQLQGTASHTTVQNVHVMADNAVVATNVNVGAGRTVEKSAPEEK